MALYCIEMQNVMTWVGGVVVLKREYLSVNIYDLWFDLGKNCFRSWALFERYVYQLGRTFRFLGENKLQTFDNSFIPSKMQ